MAAKLVFSLVILQQNIFNHRFFHSGGRYEISRLLQYL